MKRNKEKKNDQNPTGVCLGRFQSVRRYLSVVCCYCPQRNPLGSSVHSRVDDCIVGNVKRKVITQNEEKSRVVVRCETAVLGDRGFDLCAPLWRRKKKSKFIPNSTTFSSNGSGSLYSSQLYVPTVQF